MTTFYVATGDGLVVITRCSNKWRARRALSSGPASCIAADQLQPARAFCGMRQQGIWCTDDAGGQWRPVFQGIPCDQVTTVAVSGAQDANGLGAVYVGTEPSAIFRSDDGGETWRNCEGLSDLPSASKWSFPPRPHTHHVRWIATDPHAPGKLYVAIEAGALISSPDGGATWNDRVPGGPYDTHELATHTQAPGRLWSAAGDGFFESKNAGSSWRKSENGLGFRYCWSVAIDAAEPETIILSASPGPQQAHRAKQAESGIYRRTGEGPWQEVRVGLPPREGTRVPVVRTNPAERGSFYAAAEGDLYRSSDAGATWERLDVEWPADRPDSRILDLAVAEID